MWCPLYKGKIEEVINDNMHQRYYLSEKESPGINRHYNYNSKSEKENAC
jgi:hypothetical protein